MKIVEAQVEDQRKLLFQTELELATSRQLALDLKAQLQKVKEATQLAKEAAEAEKQASYLLGIEETQVRLTEELVETYKDYCNATWDRAFDVVGVPADSVWRQPGSIYYHPDIREVPGAIPSPSALDLETFEQPLTIQAVLPLPVTLKGSSQAGDQG